MCESITVVSFFKKNLMHNWKKEKDAYLCYSLCYVCNVYNINQQWFYLILFYFILFYLNEVINRGLLIWIRKAVSQCNWKKLDLLEIFKV